MAAKQDSPIMNVLHDDGFSYCSSPEHEDSEFYALAPDIRIFSQRIIERSMRNACSLLLAHETLKLYAYREKRQT